MMANYCGSNQLLSPTLSGPSPGAVVSQALALGPAARPRVAQPTAADASRPGISRSHLKVAASTARSWSCSILRLGWRS